MTDIDMGDCEPSEPLATPEKALAGLSVPELRDETDLNVPLPWWHDLGLDHGEGYEFIRQMAYHEAGHLWAAHGLGLPIEAAALTWDRERPAMDPREAEVYAVAAVVAQATVREVDYWSEDGCHGPVNSAHIDLYGCWESAWDFGDGRCFCRHGSDLEAVPFIDADAEDPRSRIIPMVDRLLADWRAIDALAELLLKGSVVTPDEIRACLRLRGPRALRPKGHL